ncbi:unnamed protein product [Pleuronectes platessa]|uniref:Uncharacterized protein n=1 Tax=Pleuronectes platessa TaxID=8262 RepID=A0A9N7YC90_PLEPL|nr:unnamed protein product [Pleuronectes platessa]
MDPERAAWCTSSCRNQRTARARDAGGGRCVSGKDRVCVRVCPRRHRLLLRHETNRGGYRSGFEPGAEVRSCGRTVRVSGVFIAPSPWSSAPGYQRLSLGLLSLPVSVCGEVASQQHSSSSSSSFHHSPSCCGRRE